MRFESPEYFWLLLCIPVYFLWKWFFQKQEPAIYLPALEDMLQIAGRRGKVIQILRTTLLLSIFTIFLLVLARPQSINPEKNISKNGIDILIALDVSESMLAEDLQPNRLEAAKKYMIDFVEKLVSDRVGLIVFSGQPFTQSPMTFDAKVISYYIEEISTKTINQRYRGMGGTAIGDAILSATNRLKNNKDRTKIIILITDGDANVGIDPLFTAENARSEDIKIYSIGIGSKEGAKIPVGMHNGKKKYAQDSSGNFVKTKFNEESLQQISKISGGKYYRAVDNNSLRNALKEINSLEKTEIETEVIETYEEEYWYFTAVLFALLFGLVVFYFRYPIQK